jgi:hypothetical protein
MVGVSAPAVRQACPSTRGLTNSHAATFIEVVDGEFVVKPVGATPNHYLAPRLADEFTRQWPA